MLIITVQEYDGTNVAVAWHIGENLPTLPSGNLLNELKVHRVQADGDELIHIRARFTNLPMDRGTGSVMRWYGDDAKFIMGNL